MDVDQRPAVVETHKRFGDLEMDTIIGRKHKGAIVTIDDRPAACYSCAKCPERNRLFAEPYHSWERGSNEDLNGLIRQYNHPKQTDFDTLSDEFIQYVQAQINSRPRKRFNVDSPVDVFERLPDEPSIVFMGWIRRFDPHAGEKS
ncbi:hypothetical protein [Gemmatimonas sp.]|uniref:hypothetical protein n=1 Tax=Gemmatimonas sp. TaxID=1962908 RepID=UPI003563FCB6